MITTPTITTPTMKPMQEGTLHRLNQKANELLTTSNKVTDDSVHEANQVQQRVCAQGSIHHGTQLDYLIPHLPPMREIDVLHTSHGVLLRADSRQPDANDVRDALGNQNLRQKKSLEDLNKESKRLRKTVKKMKSAPRSVPLTERQQGKLEVILDILSQAKQNFISLFLRPLVRHRPLIKTAGEAS